MAAMQNSIFDVQINETDLQSISNRSSLFEFLHNKLNWLVDPEDTFTYNIGELQGTKDGIIEVSRLVPFTSGDPYMIVLLEKDADFLRSDLRTVLQGIRQKMRKESAYKSRQINKILFLCVSCNYHIIRFAEFQELEGRQPRLRVFGWKTDHTDESRTLCEMNLPSLYLPMDENNHPDWLKANWDKAFDVEKVTQDFFEEYSKVFNEVNVKVSAFSSDRERWDFTQKLFNRLLFIAFIQKKGWLKLNGNTDYLNTLWNDYRSSDHTKDTFYSNRLKVLFFCGLNNSHEQEINGAGDGEIGRLIGQVPFLNGGLFEREPDDEIGKVPDDCFNSILERLFNRFNFTVMESTPLDVDVAVDPEMLGKVFEELVTGRKETGSYYTPKSIVSFMCKETLKGYLLDKAPEESSETIREFVEERISQNLRDPEKILDLLRKVRVCDPACGSGAYLLGMLHELIEMRSCLFKDRKLDQASIYQKKLEIIQNNLYGVDLEPFAVNIARLRLWLSLAVEYEGETPPALPNLDFKIEQGDSLTAPDPSGGKEPDMIRLEKIERFTNLKEKFMTAHGGAKKEMRKQVEVARKEIAKWESQSKKPEGFDWHVEFIEIFSEGGFDIVIANPPYGATVQDSVRTLYFKKEDGSQSKDTYGLFMARALQLMKPGARFSYIISDTWRTIRTHLPLRKRLLEKTSISHVLDLPSWIFNATVNTSILTLQNKPADTDHLLIAGDLRPIPKGDWNSLEENLAQVANNGLDIQTTTYARYTYPQELISSYKNCSFFIASPKLYGLMSDKNYCPLNQMADVKVGLQTGDNPFYLRKSPQARGSYQILDEKLLLSGEEIAGFTEKEKLNGVDPAKYGGKHFIPYDKGGESDVGDGWLPNYYVPTQYFIDWSKNSVKRMKTLTVAQRKRINGEASRIKTEDKTKIASRFQNSEFYFKQGLTFSDSGQYSPTFRYNSCSVFDQKGSTIIPANNISNETLLGILTSIFARYIYKSFINHTISSHVESISRLPIPKQPIDNSIFDFYVKSIINNQIKNSHYNYFKYEQKEIDRLVFELYGLTEADIREVKLWYCRRYPKLAEAQGILAEMQNAEVSAS